MRVIDTAKIVMQGAVDAVVELIGVKRKSVHFHQLGFFSQAPAGARALVLMIGGNPDNTVSLMAYSPEMDLPFTLEDGESAQYNLNTGKYWIMRNDGDIHTNAVIRCENVVTDNGTNLNDHVHQYVTPSIPAGPGDTSAPKGAA